MSSDHLTFVPAEIIRHKRDGRVHSDDEIRFMIQGVTDRSLPDEQAAAWLMAIYHKGMNHQETTTLMQSMRHSGEVLDFSHCAEAKVDKHSTGGVGDKTSLILAPLVRAAGLRVPMIAGRGLGHTGGTLDKLEAIPGFSTQIPLPRFKEIIGDFGCAIIGQTPEICPADKKLYALRDTTATIESLPLICGSIMSKKLAEGIDSLVLDVKFGSGAFMKTVEQAEELARALCAIGENDGKKVTAFLTSMEQPLGRLIGNSLEVIECLAIMKQEGWGQHSLQDFADTQELTLELAGSMIWLGGQAASHREGYEKAKELLINGRAYELFEEMCSLQGGDLSALPQTSPHQQVLRAPKSGFIKSMDTTEVGMASLLLGAGRKTQTDVIDPVAGLEIHVKLGDSVQEGDPLFTLHSSDEQLFSAAMERLLASLEFSEQKTQVPSLIEKQITL